jgi:hypothetical protein
MRGFRTNSMAFFPHRSWVGSGITSNESAMAVVDPHPDGSKRPGGCDDEIQVPVTIHVAGDNTQAPSLGGNAEGAQTDTTRKIKVNSVPEAARTPTLCLDDGQVRMAITVQISNHTALIAKRKRGGKLCGWTGSCFRRPAGRG